MCHGTRYTILSITGNKLFRILREHRRSGRSGAGVRDLLSGALQVGIYGARGRRGSLCSTQYTVVRRVLRVVDVHRAMIEFMGDSFVTTQHSTAKYSKG